MQLFAPFEVALEAFLETSSQASLEALLYMDEHVELAPGQTYVSVHGTSITAQAVEIPITVEDRIKAINDFRRLHPPATRTT